MTNMKDVDNDSGDMLSIIVTSRGFFKPVYSFLHSEKVLAELTMKRALREQGTLSIDDVLYDLRREKAMSGLYLMEDSDGDVIASAEKPSAFREEFRISYGTLSIEMRRLKWWNREFGVFWDDEAIGRLKSQGILRTRVEMVAPDNFPVELVGFVYWLAQLMWNRQQAAAAG